MADQDLHRSQDSGPARTLVHNADSIYEEMSFRDDDTGGSPAQTPAYTLPNRSYTGFLHVPRHPSIREQRNLRGFVNEDTGVSYNVKPISRPKDYPALDFRPTILSRPATIILTIIYLGVGLGLVVIFLEAGSDREMKLTSINAYIVARYGPVVLGTITLLIFRNMASQLVRLMPYIAMADQGEARTGATAKRSIAASYFPFHNPFKPNTTFGWFKTLSVFFTGFIVSLKTVLLTVDTNSEGQWVVTIHAMPAKILIGGYGLMTTFTMTVTIYLWSRSTGLQTDWNPASIADIVALFNNFNVSLDGIELEHDRRVYNIANQNLRYRLGYWSLESQIEESEPLIVYGIRAFNMEDPAGWLGPARSSTMPITRNDTRPLTNIIPQRAARRGERLYHIADALRDSFFRTDSAGAGVDVPLHREPSSQIPTRSLLESVGHTSNGPQPSNTLCSCDTRPYCIHYPYRRTLFYSQYGLVFWLVILLGSIGLLLYCWFESYVANGFTLNNTWYEYLTYLPTNSTNSTTVTVGTNQTLKAGNSWISGPWAPDPQHDLVLYAAVFRSVPAYVSGFFVDTFLGSIDINHRFIQPFLNMHVTPGIPSQTILLDYMTISPLEVSLQAWNNSHYKVAWFSFLYTISPLFPIAIIGLNSFTNTGKVVVLNFSGTAFIIILCWLVVYIISLMLAWPTTKRMVPRNFNCLLDIMAMCHASNFLQRPEFKACQPWWTKEHLKSHISVRDDRYLFGHYIGVDQKIHIGFEVAETHAKHFLSYGAVNDSGEQTGLVEWVAPLTRKERRKCRKRNNRQEKSKIEAGILSTPNDGSTEGGRAGDDIELRSLV